TDADVDGEHIRTLLLTFFFRYLPELINKGYMYIAQPPLFKVQKGKEIQYAYSDTERDTILKSMKVDIKPVITDGEATLDSATQVTSKNNIIIQRYKGLGEMNPESSFRKSSIVKPASSSIIDCNKGLGEMNPDQLWETTMNPENRVLKQVTADDAAAADEVFTMLMGDEVPPRKRFIQTHAKLATLDI
ncbi:DNA topoisomerase IV subunit B, partial [Patescibacteria group bacterium]|nr:DNA topoisomerase IV subunit B [Patescibacteria group bacterium]